MSPDISGRQARPKPFLLPQYCKGCGRCIAACPKKCIAFTGEVNPETGCVPVSIDYDKCVACGTCFSACPEPYALHPDNIKYFWELPAQEQEKAEREQLPSAVPIPDKCIPLPPTEPLMIKGTYASAIGALLAGCRHFFGYPITPSTEGAELMAKILPHIDGVFIQAVSEVAAINYMYGCGGAGRPCMTFTSSPGFSLMLEGISYMIGAEVPGVIVNIMRGGPGLGNIGPEQSDIKLVCRGLGHGNTHALALAPSDPQEMLDLTMDAFRLAFKYRQPVILLGDGYLGQVTSQVKLPDHMVEPGVPEWAVSGDREHRANVITSIRLTEADLEQFNLHLNEVYAQIIENEQRSDTFMADDCEVLFVAANTPARMTKGAIRTLRAQGVKAGLFRPISLWPFPIKALKELLLTGRVRRVIVVEASYGQLEDEMRLALSRAGLTDIPPIAHVQHSGGVLPQSSEIVQYALNMEVPE
ncbi:MAG: 3-methyl-2-oxobutanoate dehydrogenase subunit VorB [Candidatus Bruticola sp.]